MSKTIIKSQFKPADLKAMESTDNKPCAIHRYTSFYFAFEILEREKSFEIGRTSIPKADIEFLSLTERYTQQNKYEPLGKLLSFLAKLETLQGVNPEHIKEHARPLIPLANSLCEELKINNSSYHSLLNEGLGSIHQTNGFDLNKPRSMSGPSV
jgi:hypothetical protein